MMNPLQVPDTRLFKILQVMHEPIKGNFFNFALTVCLFTAVWSLHPTSINEMLAPDAVCVFVKISSKIFNL